MKANLSSAAGEERSLLEPFDLIRAEMQEVEALLLAQSASPIATVHDISHHILSAGGKRVRPALLLISAHAVNGNSPWASRLAAAMELLHTATLMHDDVVDHSDWRRGRVAAHQRWGYSASILSGDVMFTKAMRILVDYGDLAVLDTVTTAMIQVCEGEVLEIGVNGNLDVDMETYLRIIHAKTAALIAACCKVGAMAGGAAPSLVESLESFGCHLGMAFQIIDDLLDLTASQEHLGKSIGDDLKEGRVTLPLIYTLRRANSADRAVLKTILQSPHAAAGRITEAVALAERYDGLQAARGDAEEQVRLARECLAVVPATPAREMLRVMAGYAVQRDR